MICHEHLILILSELSNNLTFLNRSLLNYRIHKNNSIGLSLKEGGANLTYLIKLKELIKGPFEANKFRTCYFTTNYEDVYKVVWEFKGWCDSKKYNQFLYSWIYCYMQNYLIQACFLLKCCLYLSLSLNLKSKSLRIR